MKTEKIEEIANEILHHMVEVFDKHQACPAEQGIVIGEVFGRSASVIFDLDYEPIMIGVSELIKQLAISKDDIRKNSKQGGSNEKAN